MLGGKETRIMRHATAIAIIIVTWLALLAGYVFHRQNLAILSARDWVNHTYEVKGHIQDLQNRLRDAISGARTYIFTNDEAFLPTYYDAIRPLSSKPPANHISEQRLSIAEETALLRQQTTDSVEEQKTLDDIEGVTHELEAYLVTALAKHKAHTVDLSNELDPRPTRQYLDRLRGLLSAMMSQEDSYLTIRRQEDAHDIKQTNILILSCIAVFYVLLVLAISIYQRTRALAQAALIVYNKQLRQNEEDLKMQQEELKASNEEIEASNEELEEQNSQIRRQAEELRKNKDVIEQKAREVERASHYKTEFLANMSHELRTPLNSLLILSRSLASNEEGNLNGEQVEEAQIIYNDGLELLNLINDILDLSKVEAGKLSVVIEDIEISGILHRLRQQFTAIAKERQVIFPIEIEGDLPAILYTDAHRVEQILKNLLSNAFKFTGQGSVTLRVYRPKLVEVQRASLQQGQSIAFAVADTGIGIDPSRFKDIFEAFQQEDGATDRIYGGTGLGLTIARKFAHLLGGEIHIDSQKGVGSTFTLVLPMMANGSKMNPADVAALSETPATELAGMSVQMKALAHATLEEFIPDDRRLIDAKDKVLLIVEDDRNFAISLMKIARKRGYKCLTAGNGRTALLMAVEMPVTAIILDLKLPDIDGMQVLEQMKSNLRLRHIPIHIISGTQPTDNVVPLHKGAIGYLTKPVAREGIEEAFTRIEAILQADMKRILAVEGTRENQIAIRSLLQRKDISIVLADTGQAAWVQLKAVEFDCVILDFCLPDMSGLEWLERAESQLAPRPLPPVIIYTAKNLSADEAQRLSRYTSSIIIKGAKSPGRLLDEATLFLHSLESSLPPAQRDMIRMQHDPDKTLQGRTVLLVDDDMRNTFALSKLLKKHGVNVLLADNGAMALDKLGEDHSIELVIMDIMMPMMDGYQAMREIRANKQLTHLPIIAMTARAMPEEQQKCMESGANDYMTKPVDTERLLTLLRVWLFQREERA